MPGIICDDKIVMLEARGNSTEIMTFKNRMHVVKDLLNNGAIVEGSGGWSGAEHKSALTEIEEYIQQIRKDFDEYEAEQEKAAEDLSAAPCSVWEFEYCRRSDCETYKVRYRAFDMMDAYAQFESDIDPDDVFWVKHSQNK